MTETKSELAPEIMDPPFPVVTILTTLAILFVFVGLVGLIYYYSNNLDATAPVVITGEQKLAELVGSQNDQLNNYGYDKQLNSVRIPVAISVERMIEAGRSTGKLPFPMKPKPEALPTPAAAPAAPAAGKDAPAKDAPRDKK
jgi:hypothetical protein